MMCDSDPGSGGMKRGRSHSPVIQCALKIAPRAFRCRGIIIGGTGPGGELVRQGRRLDRHWGVL